MRTEEGSRTDSSKGRSARSRSRQRPLALSERVATGVLLGLVFLALLAFGASDVTTATLFSALYALFLTGLIASCAWARRDLARLRGDGVLAAFFGALMVAVLWPLTPWGPGGVHPVWDYLPGHKGSLTLDRSALALNVVQFLGLACLFVAGRVIGVSERRAYWLLRAAVFALGLYGVGALSAHVGAGPYTRLTATLLSPNSTATTLGGGLILAAGFATYRLQRGVGMSMLRRLDPQLVLALGAIGFLAVDLLLTASRAGLAATLAGAAVFLIWQALSQRRRIGVPAIVGGAVLVLAIGFMGLRSVSGVVERFSVAHADAAVRMTIVTSHWEAFRTAPWTGFGLGSFPTVNQLIITRANLQTLYEVRAVHNLYVQWLEEGGIVGAAAMTALFLAIMLPILKGGFRDAASSIYCRAVVCAAIVFLVHGVTDFALQVPAIQALAALVLGVVGGWAGGAPRASLREAPPAWRGRLVGGAALVAASIALSAAAPLMVGKLGGDLTGLPAAPADALAGEIERGLDQADATVAEKRRLERLSDRELAMRPASGSAWLRQAAVENALGDQALANQALERSFAVAPLQTSLFARRTLFAYEHWDVLSASAREQTIYQFETEWSRRKNPKAFVAMANDLHNPAGRVAMALQIAVLRLEPSLVPTP